MVQTLRALTGQKTWDPGVRARRRSAKDADLSFHVKNALTATLVQIRGDGIPSLLLECGLRLHEHLGDVMGLRHRAEAGPGGSQDLVGSRNLRTHPGDLEPESCKKGAGVHRQEWVHRYQAGRTTSQLDPRTSRYRWQKQAQRGIALVQGHTARSL